MAKYLQKPVIVDATQWIKHGDYPDIIPYKINDAVKYKLPINCGIIRTTTNGFDDYKLIVSGDWIIKNSNGEISLCKQAVFNQIYEIVV